MTAVPKVGLEPTRSFEQRILSGAEPTSDTPISEKGHLESPEVAPNDHTPGQSVGNQGGPDAVELALADAITKAANAGAFDVLPKLVAELEARRKARLEVVDLAAERAKRGPR